MLSPKDTRALPARLLALLAIALIACTETSKGCRKGSTTEPLPPPVVRLYHLPPYHPDNADPLKDEFFHEPFLDINGAEINLANFRGTAVVVLMFPSFRTESGRESLLILERLQRERPGQFEGVIVPIEDKEVVKPAIVSDPRSIWFLFRKNGKSNASLIDKYAEFFWDNDIISIDYPVDPPERHKTSPFFWVIDGGGNIREKLIDYSAEGKVTFEDLEIVLNALLGPAPEQPLSGAAQSSASQTEEVKN